MQGGRIVDKTLLQMAAQLRALEAIILLALRPIVLWYFQVNRRTKALEGIDESLRALPAVMRRDQASGRTRSRAA
jgi:hypothetical protein